MVGQMERKHIITIAGRPGSGKSTTADTVAARLGYTRFSSGDFMREIAKKRNVSIEELNHIAEKEHSIDEEVDESLRKLRENDLLVVDSRLAFHWIPESFKVFLDLPVEIAAKRLFGTMHEQRREQNEKARTVEEIGKNIEKRLKSEAKRYKELYGITPYDLDQFDFVIDTTDNTPDVVATMIIEKYTEWLGKE